MNKSSVFPIIYLALGLIFAICPIVRAEDPFTIKELWVGEFKQIEPSWKGKMELYIRYKSGQKDPRDVEGLITWHDLGNARTKISGTRTAEGMEFAELECVSGDCSKIVVGGHYSGKFDQSGIKFDGSAKLKPIGLTGRFSLERIIVPE